MYRCREKKLNSGEGFIILGQTTRGGPQKLNPCSWGVKKMIYIDIEKLPAHPPYVTLYHFADKANKRLGTRQGLAYKKLDLYKPINNQSQKWMKN